MLLTSTKDFALKFNLILQATRFWSTVSCLPSRAEERDPSLSWLCWTFSGSCCNLILIVNALFIIFFCFFSCSFSVLISSPFEEIGSEIRIYIKEKNVIAIPKRRGTNFRIYLWLFVCYFLVRHKVLVCGYNRVMNCLITVIND